MCDKKTSEKYLQEYLMLKNRLEGSRRAVRFLKDQAESTMEIIRNTHSDSQDGSAGVSPVSDTVSCQIQKAEQNLNALIEEVTLKGFLISSAICKMSLPEKYSLIPEILLDKYIRGEDDRTIMENRHISKTTYWRWLQIGYENFEMPDIDGYVLKD